ncbi:MAG TPA: hypothetical protein PK845_07945, partial [Petrotogaceae bacterium]|nr:hypothetical protein [Petrotogaceae bacterium]
MLTYLNSDPKIIRNKSEAQILKEKIRAEVEKLKKEEKKKRVEKILNSEEINYLNKKEMVVALLYKKFNKDFTSHITQYEEIV